MIPASSFRALGHRNFRLYIAGQGVSITGTWMQQVAMAWLVFQLTGSALWLGVVGFAGQIPALLLTPLAGGVIDRSNRHRLLLVTQTLALTQAFALALLTLSGVVAAWQIVTLALFLGIINALDIPTRQSFLSELVGKGQDLANAIAINSSVFNGARLVGPALAGLVLFWTNPGICFLINGFSYMAVLAALLAMKLPPRPSVVSTGALLGRVCEGLVYAWKTASIRSLLVLIGLFNMAGMAELTLLPVVAKKDLHGNASTLAALSAAAGAGAFAAAVLLASRRSIVGLSRWLAAAPVLFALGLIAFSFAGVLWASILLLITTGFSLLLMTAGANTLLQTTVADDKRGRIMSLYTMAVTGLSPVGGLLAGLLANHLGALLTLRLAGLACLGSSALFVLRRTPHASTPGQSDLVPAAYGERKIVFTAAGLCRKAG